MSGTYLSHIEQHIVRTEHLIAEQEGRVRELREAGLDASEAERMLATFHDSVEVFRKHRDVILAGPPDEDSPVGTLASTGARQRSLPAG